MEKYIFCISCYCDTEEKQDLLKSQIKHIKSMGYETCIISPIPFTEEIQELSDYSFITAQNEVLKWPNKGMRLWYKISDGKNNFTMTNVIEDHGWAGLSHILQTGKLMNNYGYENFIFTIYDSIYDESHIEEIMNTEENLIFPTKDKNSTYPIGFHLLFLNKNSFDLMCKSVNKNHYINSRDLIYDYVQKQLIDKHNFNISKNYVSEHIYLNNGKEFWSHSDDKKELNYFIGIYKSIKLLFYNNVIKKHVEIIANNQTIFKGNLDDITFIETKTSLDSLENMKIIIDEKEIDITSKIKSINMTNIEV